MLSYRRNRALYNEGKLKLLQSKIIFVCLCLLLILGSKVKGQTTKPNILFIMTDQQNANMLSATGNRWVKTPNLDKLSNRGVRFNKAYATDPVCVPSRFSLQTGLFASVIRDRKNESKINTEKNEKLITKAIGQTFRNAGYETIYGGKIHLPGHSRKIAPYGFKLLTKNSRTDLNAGREYLADISAKYLLNRGTKSQPFFMFLSFINPHDINYDAIQDLAPKSSYAKSIPQPFKNAMRKPKNISEDEFFDRYCPPLPDNFEPTVGEPQAIQDLISRRYWHGRARKQWGSKQWRMHRWAYAHLTERVDSLIGIVLDALNKAKLTDNTIVVFTSDHGDMDASHRLEGKILFYEESSRIPFIFAGKNILQEKVDNKHLISNGLDLYPTLCDLAGINCPKGLSGISLKPYLSGTKVFDKRQYLFIENEIGFMVRDGRFKYTWYDSTNEEMFIDLKNDPGELVNIIPFMKQYRNEYHEKYVELKKALLAHLKKLKKEGASINLKNWPK